MQLHGRKSRNGFMAQTPHPQVRLNLWKKTALNILCTAGSLGTQTLMSTATASHYGAAEVLHYSLYDFYNY